MSRAVRKQLFDTLETLQQVHDVIKNLSGNETADSVRELLTEAQNGAIAIGNRIEKLYGEGTESVKNLENYCEVLYQFALVCEQSEEIERYYIKLSNCMKEIQTSMEREIPDRLEVVFLPYKASMWDSLESVWFAARDDEDCDDYVIPIPYYDKNPDGTFREEHFEGNEYPDYVPVTKYDEYDFEAHHPDIIYIHNPYDDANYVTSVHPFFYSKNLKQFTDKLVYIPYFILEEIDPNNQAAVEGIKHFVTVPGVFNADRVIVQSEAMKQAYINVIVGLIGDNEKNRAFLEEKISGAGSPKIDKVLNTRREDLDIPEEWLRIIKKPDGTWKKIVFYNTSVTALLQNDEKMLEKMKSVFEIFKEQKEEVALLWRPHPLIKATIESMRPRLWEEYEKMVAQYKEEGWGIYDDSADVDRAVAVCDGYYGDNSSVVQLLKKAGKICMIQNAEII